MHLDVQDKAWRSKACGPTALKSILDYLGTNAPTIDELIRLRAQFHAYDPRIGWIHDGLAEMARSFGLGAAVLPWRKLDPEAIVNNLRFAIRRGPCLALIHPAEQSIITQPNFVVIKAISTTRIFFNDPAAQCKHRVYQRAKIPLFLERWADRKVVSVKKLSAV